MLRKAMFAFLVCTAVVACKKSTTTPAYTPECTGVAPSFSATVLPLMKSSCAGCHSKYSGYSGISGDKASVRSAIVGGTMPQRSSMTTAQKNSVVCWIDNGAANN